MSRLVKERLDELGIETTHKEREEIDVEIEKRTGKYCDEGVQELNDEEIKELVAKIKKRMKKKEIAYCV